MVDESYPRPYAHYILLERLGVGGMSEVDLARNAVEDGSFVRFAVIKRIKTDYAADESFVRMFKDEARITSELHHANIGTVYDFGRVGDEWYLALEYVPGIDLRFLVNTLRERGQRVPIKVALRVIADVLDALAYAHDKKDTFGKPMGIVHRDVNPRNVMLSIRGEVKLIDFGVAKATDRLEHTRADHVKGKFAYMAPEQLTAAEVDHRSDLYAVGLVLYELLAGTSPFAGLNQVQILHRMVHATVPELPPIPELADDRFLREVHARALAPDPADRYPDAAAFARDVRAVGESIGGLPSQDQLAAFLTAVDPDLTRRLRSRMEHYARLEMAHLERTVPLRRVDDTGQDSLVGFRAPFGSESASSSGSLAKRPGFGGSAPGEPRAVPSVARTGMLAGSVLLVSLVSAVVAGTIVAIVLLVVFFVLGREPAAPLAPIQPVAPAVPVLEPPEPEIPPADEPPAEPEPAPRPRARPGSRRPAPVEPAPTEGGGEPDLRLGGEQDPFRAPAPIEVIPVPPVPVPHQPEMATGFGYLNVSAGTEGVPVLVDGVEVGPTPLLRYRIPAGPHTVAASGFRCTPDAVEVRKSQVVNVLCK